MNFQFLSKKNIFLLLLPLVLGSLFLAAPQAQAFFGIPFEIYSAQLDALSFIDDSLLKILLWLAILAVEASAFLAVSAALLDWSSTLPVDLNNNALVSAGWNFTAGLANMLFILIFIAIALAYIFKSESWGMKKALPSLIGVALLINFSLLFVKIFVDIGWIIQNSFKTVLWADKGFAAAAMKPVLDQLGSIGTNFVGNLLIYFPIALIPFAPLAKLIWYGITIGSELINGTFSQTILLIIFSSATGFIFLIYAILFLVRISIIWLLAIAAPLAFMAFILPATQKFFSQWFRLLLQWVFLGVVVFFLMGLGIKLFAVVTPESTGGGFTKILQGKKDFFDGYIKMIFLIVYLWVSLSMSRKFVPAGMNFVQSWAELGMKKGGKWTSEQTRKWGLTAQAGGATAIAGAKRRFDERVAARTAAGMPLSWRQRVAKRVTGQVRPELLEARALAARRTLVKDQRNRLLGKTKDMDEEGIKAVLRAELEKYQRAPLKDKNKHIALAELLIEKNAQKDTDKNFVQEAWKSSGPDDVARNPLKRNALKKMLHWAEPREMSDLISRMNSADIDNLDNVAKASDKVIRAIVGTMRSDFISRLGSQSEIVFEKVQDQIKTTLGEKWKTAPDTLSRKELGVLRNLHLSAATTNLNWETYGSLQEIEDKMKSFGGTPKPPKKPEIWTPGQGPEIAPKPKK